MSQTHNSEVQQMHTRASSPLVRVFSKRIAWLSIAMCLLLLAGIVGITQKNVGADAASAKKGVSSPKHAPSPHHLAHPFSYSKGMPAMSVSPANLTFTESLAHPLVAPQTLTITNNGVRVLCWWTTVTTAQSSVAWIASYGPVKGTVGTGKTLQMMFTIKPAAQLQPGTYTAKLALTGTDKSGIIVAGSPQTVNLTLNVTQ